MNKGKLCNQGNFCCLVYKVSKTVPLRSDNSSTRRFRPTIKSQFEVYIERENAFSVPYVFSGGSHPLELCGKLARLPYYDRTDIVKCKGYCFGCLRTDHGRMVCQNKATSVYCGGRHLSVLHVEGKVPTRENINT